MQQRLVSLVGRVTQDDITAELLRLNDELNNAFIRSEDGVDVRGRQARCDFERDLFFVVFCWLGRCVE